MSIASPAQQPCSLVRRAVKRPELLRHHVDPAAELKMALGKARSLLDWLCALLYTGGGSWYFQVPGWQPLWHCVSVISEQSCHIGKEIHGTITSVVQSGFGQQGQLLSFLLIRFVVLVWNSGTRTPEAIVAKCQ